MKKLTLALAVFCAATSTVISNPATAGPPTSEPTPDGFYCGFTAVTDPNPEADANDMSGEIDAGPATTSVPATMVCTIQINSPTHNGPDAASRSFPSDANGVIAGVQTVTYSTAEDAQAYMCTSFIIHNGPGAADDDTVYYNSGNDVWHDDPNSECSSATSGGTDDVWDIIDGVTCPEFAAQEGWVHYNTIYIDEEGDIFVDQDGDGINEADAMDEMVYDCPDYTFTINDENANPDAASGGVIDCVTPPPGGCPPPSFRQN